MSQRLNTQTRSVYHYKRDTTKSGAQNSCGHYWELSEEIYKGISPEHREDYVQ